MYVVTGIWASVVIYFMQWIPGVERFTKSTIRFISRFSVQFGIPCFFVLLSRNSIHQHKIYTLIIHYLHFTKKINYSQGHVM